MIQRRGVARPGSEGREPRELGGLSPAERRALAVLTVAGGAAVPSRLAALADGDDAAAALVSLERRGLVVGDDRGRFTIPPVLLERLRRGWNVTAAGESLLLRLVALAPMRVVSAEDLGFVLAAARWAVESRRWSAVLRLVRAVGTGANVLARPEEWLELLGYGLDAARAVGDGDAEAWTLEQMSGAAAATGDAASAERLLRAARRLHRDLRLAAEGAGLRRALWRLAEPGGSAARVAVGAALLVTLGLGGLALGLAVFDEDTATGAVATFTIVETTVGERTATVTTTVERRRTVTARPRGRVVLRTVTEPTAPTAPFETVVSTQTVPVVTTIVVPTTVRVPMTVVVTTTVVAPATVAPTAPAPP
jgi:hypothetical protein